MVFGDCEQINYLIVFVRIVEGPVSMLSTSIDSSKGLFMKKHSISVLIESFFQYFHGN